MTNGLSAIDADGSDFLAGGGEMGALARARDWAGTPLGPMVSWPQSLRALAGACLNCGFPMLLWWGPSLTMLYNDGFRPILGDRHPETLGQAGRDGRLERWAMLGPMLEQVLATGETARMDGPTFHPAQNSSQTRSHFSFSLSPVRDETGGIADVLCVAFEKPVIPAGAMRPESAADFGDALRADLPQPLREFTETLQNSPVVVFSQDRDLRYTWIYNPALGQTAANVIGKTDNDLFERVEDAEHLIAIKRRVLETGEPAREEVSVRGQGAVRWFDLSIRPWRGDSPLMGIRCTAVDITERKRAEAALQEREERLQLALWASGGAAWDWDLLTGEVQVSNSYRELTGLPEDQPVTFENWLAAVHPADRGHCRRYCEGLFESRCSLNFSIEFRVIHPNRGLRWLQGIGRVGRDASRRAIRLIGINFDITARKETEASLRQALIAAAEERGRMLDAVFEHVPEGVILVDAPNGHIRTTSRHIRDLLGGNPAGLSTEESIRRYPAFREDGKTPLAAADLPRSRALRGEVVRDFEMVREGPDGRRIRLLSHAGPVYDPAGTLVGAVEAWRDITAWKDAETALRESEQRFRLLVEQAGDGIFVTDAEGRYLDANSADCGLLGYSRAEILHMTITDLVASEELPRLVPELARHADGSVLRGEWRFRRKNGSEMIGEVVGRRLPDGRWQAFVRDVTERRRFEDALKDADRRKDEFLAMLAHELRNPLAPIRNALYMLGKTGNREPAMFERLHAMMQRQLQHLIQMVDDLLDVSRITQGRVELRKSRVDLADVIGHAVETSEPLIKAGRHQLAVSLPPQPLLLEADPVRLAQVLANLLNNAAKYMEPGGNIRLTAEREGREARMSVRDTGMGISADMLPQVFDLFTQVDRTLDRAQGGLGIGLSLARRLVEMHGGRIEAHSEGPGRGSEFVVTLPLAE